MHLSNDNQMRIEGRMLINKGIRLGIHAREELTETNDNNALGIGCYMLAQGLELIIKGLCKLFGTEPPHHHIIKHSAKLLLEFYNKGTVPELIMIQDDLVDISNNNFAYVVQTWQKDGRYEFITTTQEHIDKAELVYAGLVRFIKAYHLNEDE